MSARCSGPMVAKQVQIITPPPSLTVGMKYSCWHGVSKQFTVHYDQTFLLSLSAALKTEAMFLLYLPS